MIKHILMFLYEQETLGDIMIYMNIVLGLIVFVYELKEYFLIRKLNLQWAWIKFVYALIGVGWALSYFILALIPDSMVPVFGSVVVRPGITITLSVIAAGAYSRTHRN